MRQRTNAVPPTSTMMSSGVWNTTAWPSRGSNAVTPAATSTVTTTAAATRITSRIPGWRTSATVRLGRDPDGRDEDAARQRATRLRPEADLRAVEGDGEVGTHDRVRGVAGGQ